MEEYIVPLVLLGVGIYFIMNINNDEKCKYVKNSGTLNTNSDTKNNLNYLDINNNLNNLIDNNINNNLVNNNDINDNDYNFFNNDNSKNIKN